MTHCQQTPSTQSFPSVIHAHWAEAAQANGFDILQRVEDRYHLELECHACGELHICKLYVVMNNQPICPHCVETRWREDATAAGLAFLQRDTEDRHYGFYEAPCGHKLRRQFELIKRIADGECSHRCEICQNAKE
ncbi:GIY-YIG nuclease family protein, partial [Phaeobacter sp. B1627]